MEDSIPVVAPNREATAAARYNQLAIGRQPYLDRARECATLTIPTLIPQEGSSASTKFPTPFQSVGARGLNNLSSKILLALFPPNTAFFRLRVREQVNGEAPAEGDSKKDKVEKTLSDIEKQAVSYLESSNIRTTAFETNKHLICSGNALFYVPEEDEGGMRMFPLSHYVVKRDPFGTVLEILCEEDVAPMSLPEECQAIIKAADQKAENPDVSVKLYTWIKRVGKKYTIHQEVCNTVVPESEGSYPEDKLPWLALRFIKVDSEDYGRGYIEEYLGDLTSLEGLMQAIVEGSAAAARLLFLVNPNGSTKAKSLIDAPNGGFATGNAEDVTTLQTDKAGDLASAIEMSRDLTQRLSMAFLLNSAIQRNGERVTAEEIRYLAGELEDALGGIYSVLSQEFQAPLVRIILDRLIKLKLIPKEALDKKNVKTTIITGLEALGRGHDLNKIMNFIQNVKQMPPEASAAINWQKTLSRLATSSGIDQDLIHTPEEMQAQQQAAAQSQMTQDAIKGATPAVAKGMVESQMQSQGAAPAAA